MTEEMDVKIEIKTFGRIIYFVFILAVFFFFCDQCLFIVLSDRPLRQKQAVLMVITIWILSAAVSTPYVYYITLKRHIFVNFYRIFLTDEENIFSFFAVVICCFVKHQQRRIILMKI